MFSRKLRLRILVIPESDSIREVRIDPPKTLKGLIKELANTLDALFQGLTLLFPSIPPQDANVQRPSDRTKGPGIVTAHANDVNGTRWKSLVGEWGCEYTYDVEVDDLLSCWPVLDDGTGMAPLTVIKVEDNGSVSPRVNNLWLDASLKPFQMMFRLYYTKLDHRCLNLPVAEKQLDEEQTVYVRDCWEVFAKGVIRKFAKMSKFEPPTQPPNPNFPFLPDFREAPDRLTQEEINAVPRDLLASIRQTPSWIETTDLMTRFERRLSGDDDINSVFLNGQPGTGMSQMLVYLIYRLMHSLEKVAILYTPFEMSKVITILIDHTNPTTPINVRVHDSSFAEDSFIGAHPYVIRIVDSEDPFKDSNMNDIFTVFAASPKIFEDITTEMQRAELRLETTYPLWGKDEFLTMLIRVGKTDPRFWRHSLRVLKLCEMHPLVVKLLGAHGQYIPNPADREEASVMMNVIDVFGLTPRMLGKRVAGAFLDMMRALEYWNFLSSKIDNAVNISHLIFKEGKKPISLFATRLLAMLQKLRSAAFLEILHNSELEERLREQMLRSKVNNELLVSRAKLTVFSAMPNRFRSFMFQLPVIGHQAKTEDEILSRRSTAFRILTDVFYHETTYDAQARHNCRHWRGIDSFVYLQEQTPSVNEDVQTVHTLYTFKSTLSNTPNPCNTVLIDAIRDKIAGQQKVEQADINVFFLWIVLAEHVGSFRNVMQRDDLSTQLPVNTGVVSVSDLLVTESPDFRGMADVNLSEFREMKQFIATSEEFIDCFTEPTFCPPLPNVESVLIREPGSTINSNLSEFVATLENTHLSNLQPSSVQSGPLSCF
ncbi:hypothetical protein BLNAU_15525 [Blattamonas nauphoetae]|uniref:Uncharacterized protein n=1 Tax=Blattamonas nauphoetae TaxID=2049346 RepID=A0ABQ9XAP2_9EUKA|nr:hypothetical protein BLNAU_15525 [Blattamonas nauphoetae]